MGSKLKAFLNENYFIIIPILITLLLYAGSVTYGFRNFDEDIIIKNFFVKKTLGEYLEKYLLVDLSGITNAYGFTFSSIKNVHCCFLERPVFYLINFLFQAKPFLFHAWGLLLHCLVLYFLTRLIFELCQNKKIALFSGLIWSVHPTNIEPIIWATNWPALVGAIIYFYTLYKLASKTNISVIFILFLTVIQILFVEHTITIPVAIFFTLFYKYKNLKVAIKTSLPSFLVVCAYFILRMLCVEHSVQAININPLYELLKRLIFLTPQVFIHELGLVLFPQKLTIDQIDLINLDKTYFGTNHLLSIVVFITYLLIIFFSRQNFVFLSYGLILYFIGISPFLQIIPLYSMVAERYNYFGCAFFIFGLVTVISTLCNNKKKLCTFILTILCLTFSIRSYVRINEWENSSTLFLSTINTSKSFFKKGIWTYNLAISQPDEKREELLNLSINLLDLYIQNTKQFKVPSILTSYELDYNSTLAKAATRIATNYEILKKSDLQFKWLLKALEFSRPDTQIRSLIYKNLATYHFQNNDFKKAIDYYEQGNAIAPNPTINYAIAVCYLKLKDLSKYEEYLKKSVSVITAYNTSPFKTYGQLLEISKNDLIGAAKYYKIATLLENNPEPYILLATVYLKQNKIDNAFNTVKRGLYGFPGNPSLLYFHGTILLNKGRDKEGIENLIQVTEDPDTPKDIKKEAENILVNIFTRQKKQN